MSKFIKIVALAVIGLIVFSGKIYAKYTYYFEETIAEFSRDNDQPICQVSYSTEEHTNQNVTVTIVANKEIEQVSGFQLLEDQKTLTKVVTQNESKTIIIRDISGNCTTVEYGVDNIDKEPPQIIGCENGRTYKAPLILDYSDNDEIEKIEINQYEDKLVLACQGVYYDCAQYYGTGKTKSEITLQIKANPQNAKKYKYYANNQLYATSTEKEYQFAGLKAGTEYLLKVQALDNLGNILDESEITTKTSYYGSIDSQKTENQFQATFYDMESSTTKIKYAIWNVFNEKKVIWKEAEIVDKKAQIDFSQFNLTNYPNYMIHAYLYDEDDEILDIVEFSIDFATEYEEPKSKEENFYEIKKSGKYEIKVVDFAGNETIYNIKVE